MDFKGMSLQQIPPHPQAKGKEGMNWLNNMFWFALGMGTQAIFTVIVMLWPTGLPEKHRHTKDCK